MFTASQLPTWHYQHPWNVSFEDRLSAFCARERRVAYFYETPDTTTFRYRVFNMVEALNAAPEAGISASWFSVIDFERMHRFIDQADAIVLVRSRYSPIVDRIIGRARTRKIPVFFDVDDLVFDQDYVSLIIDSLDQNLDSDQIWENWFAYSGRIGATIRLCDGAITTNAYLASRISAFAPGVICRIVPNYLNRLQQERSSAIWEGKRDSHFERDGKIHIGYFSGTPTHNRDFQVASSALASIMDEDPRVLVRVVGFLDTNGPLSPYRDRIELFPLQDFVNLQRLIGEVEVNVAPLQNNVFTNCKSELKYFEAAIVGSLTVASPTFTFRNSIRDGENGFLAGAHEWEAKIRRARDLVDNPLQYSALVERAYNEMVCKYGWNCFASQIAEAILGGGIAARRNGLSSAFAIGSTGAIARAASS